MLTKSATALAAAAIVVGVVAASPAKDSGPPTVDIQQTCRENVNALGTVLGGEIRQDMNVCMSDEHDARDQLVKNWATYPALARQQCVKPQEYLPGYVEWLACIEMTKDSLQSRKEQSSASTSGISRRSSSRRAGPASEQCPFVKYTEGGSVDYVINC